VQDLLSVLGVQEWVSLLKFTDPELADLCFNIKERTKWQ
jgi:hypothetical protein